MTTTSETVALEEFEVRCRALSGQMIRTHRVLVRHAERVKVWDQVAGHYTGCHGLSASTMARIRREALAGRLAALPASERRA